MSGIYTKGLFKGKVAIVTGGGSGIGFSITKALLELGCQVVIASRKEDRIREACKRLQQHIPSARAQGDGTDNTAQGKTKAREKQNDIQLTRAIQGIACNIRKPDDVKRLMKYTLQTFGRIDFLVNNGGGQFPSPAEAISDKGWHAVIDTNLTGTFTCCREVFNAYMGEHGGSIVNIIADMFKGFPGAARAGVDNMTKTLSIEWAQAGIRVNAVAPGVIFSKTAAANYDEDDFLVSHRQHIPLKRLGTVEEVAAAVCFLLSPAAAFITGTTMRVDGGQSINPAFWNIPDHNSIPAYGTLPLNAKL